MKLEVGRTYIALSHPSVSDYNFTKYETEVIGEPEEVRVVKILSRTIRLEYVRGYHSGYWIDVKKVGNYYQLLTAPSVAYELIERS